MRCKKNYLRSFNLLEEMGAIIKDLILFERNEDQLDCPVQNLPIFEDKLISRLSSSEFSSREITFSLLRVYSLQSTPCI